MPAISRIMVIYLKLSSLKIYTMLDRFSRNSILITISSIQMRIGTEKEKLNHGNIKFVFIMYLFNLYNEVDFITIESS